MPGIVACKAAYRHGRQWLESLRKYLLGNIQFTEDFLAKHLPQVRFTQPEGTFLLWLDFQNPGLDEAKLESLVADKARLWLGRGILFGEEGAGFERVNVAYPRQVLGQALNRLSKAVCRPIPTRL